MPAQEKDNAESHTLPEEGNKSENDTGDKSETKSEVKPKSRIFVEESSLATATAINPPVNKEAVHAFFDPKTCSSTDKERLAQFEKAKQKHLAAVEVVVRPTMSKAEEAAKQADIRHSFQVSASAAEKAEKPSGTSASSGSSLGNPNSGSELERELEKLMDEEEKKIGPPSPTPTKTRQPKAKAKAKVDTADTKAKAKNFQGSGGGKGKGGSNGSSGRGRGNGNNFSKQKK